jgi:virulence factor Mce-like protein
MRRLLRIAAGLALLAAGVALALGASGGQRHTRYWVELDNAFGLIDGGDVKVAGVRAGRVDSLKVEQQAPYHALVEIELYGGRYRALRRDSTCDARQQSLIGEYFVDCRPGSSAAALPAGGTIPVAHTTSQIPLDLVQDTMRLPYRERLAIIVNELGGGVAGRAGDLNGAIRRAVPALRNTDRVLATLGGQENTIKQLTGDADRVVSALAASRTQVGRWVVAAKNTASASAARRQALAGTFQRLPGFLEQVKPTMAALGRVADEQRPALQDLSASSGQLTRFFDDLGPFANAARPSLKAFGKASKTGVGAVHTAADTVRLLAAFAKPTPELAQNLAIVLEDLNDPGRAVEDDPRAAAQAGVTGPRGYTGLEALLQYAFNQSQAANIYDQNGYMFKVSVFASKCAPYRDAQSVKADPQLYKDCASQLGPNQPGVNTPDPTAGAGAARARRAAIARGQSLQTAQRGAQAARAPPHAGQQQALDYLLAP